MARTAPVPNIPPIPGMCPSILVAAGGSDSGGSGGQGAGSGGSGGPGKGGGAADGTGGDGKSAPDPTKYPKCGTESHPVDVVTGRAFTHPIRDFELPGPLPLIFERSYSTASRKRDTNLGFGWSHTFSWEIEVRRSNLVVWTETGVSVDFPLVSVGQTRLGDWGWVIRADSWGFALDTGDGLWLIFSEKDGDRYRLTAIEDRNRNRITLTYEDGRLVEMVDSAGRRLKVVSDASGRLTSISAMNAVSQGQWVELIRYLYDEGGHLVKVTDPDGYAWRYEYDESHRITADTDRTGLTFHFVYDSESRCVEAWGDYGDRPDPSLVSTVPTMLADGKTPARGVHHCRFDYGPDGYTEVAKSTEVRRYFGNKRGTIDKEVKAGSVDSYAYDERGHLLSHANELGATYQFTRDPRGRVLKIKDPLDYEIAIERDDNGLPVKFVDAGGAKTEVIRDHAGNPVVVEYPNGGVTSYTWDSRGLPTRVVLPNGGKWTFEYDAHGNCTRRVEPDGTELRCEYDFLGQMTSETQGSWSVHYAYSPRGDLIQMRDADGLVERFEYDGEGHVVAIFDKTGRASRTVFGGYHVVCSETDASGGSIHFRYDREGQLVQIVNARGEEYRFTYDPGGYCTETKTFDGRTYSFSYDLAGRMRRVIDGLRRVTQLEYDLRDDLLSRELHDGTMEMFAYDARGELVKAESPGATIEFERDVMGSVVRETHKTAAGVFSIERAYDLMGHAVRTTTSDGLDVALERGALGEVGRTTLGFASKAGKSVADVIHRLDGDGQELERILPRGGRVQSGFDVLGRVTSRRALRAGAGPIQPGIGEPEYLGEQTRHWSFHRKFHWNDLDNLTSVSGPPGESRGYEYDAFGNLTGIQRGAVFRPDGSLDVQKPSPEVQEATKMGPGGRILEQGGTRYVWDADGQLIEKRTPAPDGTELVHRYTWTAKGLLEAVQLPDSSRVEFSYDAFWRRVEKRVSAPDVVTGALRVVKKTRFHWDDDVLVHEATEHREGSATKHEARAYWFEDDSYVPLAQHDVGDDDGGEHEWLHYVNDQVGMPEALVSADGEVVASLDRDEWGAAFMKPGARAETPVRLQGQYADVETGLHYNRFRYYDPETGSFISADPIGLAGGFDAYVYAHDPLTWIDPLGLKSKDMKLGDELEEKRVAALKKKKYKIVETKVGSGNGIDILAVKRKPTPKPHGTVISARIEECKAGQSDLGRVKSGEKQMSTTWKKTKLRQARAKALAKGDCQAVADIDGTLALMDSKPSAVQGVVVHQGVSGKKPKKGSGKPDRRKLSGPITQRTAKPVGSKEVKQGPKGKVSYPK